MIIISVFLGKVLSEEFSRINMCCQDNIEYIHVPFKTFIKPPFSIIRFVILT